MKKRNGSFWDNLFPITVATNVLTGAGITIENVLKGMADDIKSYGAKGNGVANDTAAVKAFLASGGNLIVSEGTYMIDASVYNVVSNTHLTFAGKAKFKLRPHAVDAYSMLQVKDADNVTIQDAWLDGSKDKNTFPGGGGEWGHGIDVLNSTRVHLDRPVTYNTWGDGIYIGHNYWGESLKVTEDVVVTDAFVDGARRNGISVCGGLNIKILRPHIKNIRGTNPMAGIDIEPEGMGGVKPILDNLLITEPLFENCVSGIEILLQNLKDRNLRTNVTVTSPTMRKCQIGLTIGLLSGALKGNITYTDVKVEDCELGVVRMSDYRADGTPHIIIDGLSVDGFNTDLSTNDFYNHCLIFLGLPESPALYDIGNITIINPVIKENANTVFRFMFANLQNSAKLVKKVAIVNPNITTTKERVNFIRGKHDIKIADGLRVLKNFGVYYQQSVDHTLMTHFDSAGSLDTITLTGNDPNTLIGHVVKIQVGSAARVVFRPVSFIQGYTTVAGKGMYSDTIGSSVELQFKGNYWSILSMYGGWSPEA